MRNGGLLPQGTVRIGHRNPQPPSPPVFIRTGPTVQRTVQSPNALGPACAGLFLLATLPACRPAKGSPCGCPPVIGRRQEGRPQGAPRKSRVQNDGGQCSAAIDAPSMRPG